MRDLPHRREEIVEPSRRVSKVAARHVEEALADVPGVRDVEVSYSEGKARILGWLGKGVRSSFAGLFGVLGRSLSIAFDCKYNVDREHAGKLVQLHVVRPELQLDAGLPAKRQRRAFQNGYIAENCTRFNVPESPFSIVRFA